ncbi:hypothetical protein BaRGS_00021789, partial [Batillaria attramentaria]
SRFVVRVTVCNHPTQLEVREKGSGNEKKQKTTLKEETGQSGFLTITPVPPPQPPFRPIGSRSDMYTKNSACFKNTKT